MHDDWRPLVIRSTAAAGLRRPAPDIPESSLGAGNPRARRRAPRPSQGLMAGAAFGPTSSCHLVKRFAVDQRRRRPPRRRRLPCPISSPRPRTISRGRWVAGRAGATRSCCRKDFNFLLADRSRMMTMREWERLGIRSAGGKPFPRPEDRAYLLVPAGRRGRLPDAAELPRHHEVNPAEAYALAIGHLADRSAAAGRSAAWPDTNACSPARSATSWQQLLAQRGFGVGEPDGRLGGKTRMRCAVPVEASPGARRVASGGGAGRACAAGKTVWGWQGLCGNLRPSSS